MGGDINSEGHKGEKYEKELNEMMEKTGGRRILWEITKWTNRKGKGFQKGRGIDTFITNIPTEAIQGVEVCEMWMDTDHCPIKVEIDLLKLGIFTVAKKKGKESSQKKDTKRIDLTKVTEDHIEKYKEFLKLRISEREWGWKNAVENLDERSGNRWNY